MAAQTTLGLSTKPSLHWQRGPEPSNGILEVVKVVTTDDDDDTVMVVAKHFKGNFNP